LKQFRIRFGVVTAVIGALIFVLGVHPEYFGLDRSPVVGFVQISTFLFGLALVCIGGYIALNVLWNKHQKSIPADIGLRLVATGFVISFTAGLADVFGFGTQATNEVPFFGNLQAIGVILGEIIIAIGFLIFIPYQKKTKEE